jgi:WD40 repeat protein
MGQGYIFISYSHEDETLVAQLRQELKARGAEVWLDHERLSPGTFDWEAAVRKGIAEAAFVIYIASPSAVNSRYVKSELSLAEDEQRPIIPWWIAGDTWPKAAPLGWIMTEHIDARGARFGDALIELLTWLGLDAQPAAPSATDTSAAPERKTERPTFVMPVRVFIACPGDLTIQRGVVRQALTLLNQDPRFAGTVELIAYWSEPAQVPTSATPVVDEYLLAPEDADIVVCMVWQRLGTPLAGRVDPDTGQPYQSATEYALLSAYRHSRAHGTPRILLYRSVREAPAPVTPEEVTQLERVNRFFSRFGPDSDLQGLIGTFTNDEQLADTIQRDVGVLLINELPRLLEVRASLSTGAVYFLPPLPTNFVPQPETQRALRDALLDHPATSDAHPPVVAVTGMGGLGKTAMARAICEDVSVRAAFPDGILWATLGQQPDMRRIQAEWISALGGDVMTASNVEAGAVEVRRLLARRAVLLVLDDVRDVHDMAALAVGGPQSRLLITTRDAAIAQSGIAVPIATTDLATSRRILREALRGRPLSDDTLDAVAMRVGHVPLALRIVGGQLAQGVPWGEIERALDQERASAEQPGDRNVFRAIAESVDALPFDRQERYLELVVFGEDEPLRRQAVKRLWARRLGRTVASCEFLANRLLAEFRERALIQSGDTIHDLLLDYLHQTVAPERIRELHRDLSDAYASQRPSADASPWSQLPTDDDLYGWRTISRHLSQAGRTQDLRELVTDATWLREKILLLGPDAVVTDLELLPDYAPAQQLSQAIRASAHILRQDPDELLNQIAGRVGPMPELRHLPQRRAPHFDLYTQGLPQLSPALLRILADGNAVVNSSAVSPDGRLGLSASDDATLRLWDLASGDLVRTFAGHTDAVRGCAFSPDGLLCVSASDDGTVRLWNVVSGAEMRVLTGHTSIVTACAFSPDGALILSSSWDHTLSLWEAASGLEVRRFTGHYDGVRGCAVSPDGRTALSASDDATLRLWEVATGELLRVLEGHTSAVTSCAYRPDGRLGVSASDDRTLRLWDLASGQTLRVLEGHTGAVNGCAFTPDGRLVASAANDGTLRLWEVSTGSEARRLDAYAERVRSCALSPDGRMALCASERVARLWDVTAATASVGAVGRAGEVSRCAFSSDGHYTLTASADMLRLWEVATGAVVRVFQGHTDVVNACAFSPDGRMALSGSSDRTLRLWDLTTGAAMRVLQGHAGWVTAALFTPDERRAVSASSDTTLRVWDLRSGRVVRVLQGHTGPVTDGAITANGRIILSASSDTTLRLWDSERGDALRTFVGHQGAVNACALSADARLALSASSDTTLRLWEVSSGHTLRTFEGHSSQVTDCALSANGALALSASSDSTLRVWDTGAGKEVLRWNADVPLLCCAAGPNVVAAGVKEGSLLLLNLIGLTWKTMLRDAAVGSSTIGDAQGAGSAPMAGAHSALRADDELSDDGSSQRKKRRWRF